MKLLVTFAALALVAAALAAPAEQVPAKIISSEFKHNPDGGYDFAYETEDGVKKTETGEIKPVNDEDNKPQQVVVVRGFYSWVDKDGLSHNVKYFADENGFHPESADIPTNA